MENKKKINMVGCIFLAVVGINLTIFQGVLNDFSRTFGLDIAKAGMLISIHFIGVVTAPVVFGELSDRIGKKPVLQGSLVVFLAGLAAILFSTGPLMLYAGIFLTGCGAGAAEALITGLLADYNRERLNYITNFSQMFFTVGAVLGPMLAFFIIKASGSWRYVYLVMFLIVILIFAYFSTIKVNKPTDKLFVADSLQYNKQSGKQGDKQSDEKDSKQSSRKGGIIAIQLLKNRAFLILAVAIFIYVGIEEAEAFWLKDYFSSVLNAADIGSFVLSGYWGIMVFGRFIGSRFEKRKEAAMAASLGLSLVSFIIAFTVGEPLAAGIFFVIAGLGFAIIWPTIITLACAKFRDYTGTVTGVMMTSGATGGITVPFLVGLAASGAGLEVSIWLIPMSVLVLLAAIAAYAAGEKRKRT